MTTLARGPKTTSAPTMTIERETIMFVGIDLGSTNIKAAIYNEKMELIDRQSRPANYIRDNGFVEFDAYTYCQDLIGLLSNMVKANKEYQEALKKFGRTAAEATRDAANSIRSEVNNIRGSVAEAKRESANVHRETTRSLSSASS